ncbi:MAG: hypothetical protein NTY35_11315 [Planctomycetota bacterium]|nr:hypothetical protein [Planctomycetota bacterium]
MIPLSNALRAALAPLLTLVLLVACSSSGASDREGDWVEADMTVASDRILRQIATLALQKNGFPPGTEDQAAQTTVSSSWKVQLQPFKSEGTRAKAHVMYEEKGPRTWHVAVRVEKETNEELAKPLELSRAKWESGPDDKEAASRILRTMQTVFGREFELGPKISPTDAERIQGG